MPQPPYIPVAFQNGTDGDDVLIGSDADEAYYFITNPRDRAPALSPADRIIGRGGIDVLVLQFDWQQQIVFQPATINEVESIVLMGGGDRRFGYTGATTWYDIALAADNVRAGTSLIVDATGLGRGDVAFIDATAISGQLRYRGGAGVNYAYGGGGNDVFTFGPATFGNDNSIRGGTGDDMVILQGNYRYDLSADSLQSVEQLWLLSRGDRVEGAPGAAAATSYDLRLEDQLGDAVPVFRVSGLDLLADETMRIDGSRITRSELRLSGGAGDDILIGGATGGQLLGGAGADTLSITAGGRWHVGGGAGDDTVLAGGALGSDDSLDLGMGYDRLDLDGRYANLQLGYLNGGSIVDGLDAILLHGSADASASNQYDIMLNAGLNRFVGRSIQIDASDLAAGESTRIDAKDYGESITYVAGSGTDRVTGSSTYDRFVVRSGTLQAGDRFDGGDINTMNRLRFEGGGTFALSSSNFTNISQIEFSGSGAGGSPQTHDLTLTTAAGDASAGVTIDARGLRAADSVRIHAGRYTSYLAIEAGDTNDVVTASAAGGTISTGKGADLVSIAFGVTDSANIGDATPARYTVDTGEGDDGIYVGNAFHGDRIDGGAGNDQLGLQGYYQGVTLNNITGIETIVLMSQRDDRFDRPAPDGGSYSLIAPDALVGAGQRMIVNMNTLRDGEFAGFDASRELDGSYLFFGGAGREGLIGGAGSDGFYFGRGAFGFGDVVSGGDDADDQLGLQGNYTVALGPDNMHGIETLVLLGSRMTALGGSSDTPFAYDIRITPPRAHTDVTALTISANTLDLDETLRFDGSAGDRYVYTVYAGDGQDVVRGSASDDRLYGRGGDDVLTGGGGRDTLAGGAGADVFRFTGAGDSSGARRDLILDFDPLVDRIAIAPGDDTHRQADLTGFTLSEASFDRDLSRLLDERLEVGGVVFAQAASGDLAGHGFLIADQNGVAGYQPGEDLVIELAGVTMLPGALEWLVA